MSAVFAFAAQQWRAMRADFEIVREAAYRAALDDCNGVLLNTRGKTAGIDPYSLFMGNDTRARAYASRELIDHWDRNVRPTLAAFERQMFEPQPEQEHAA